MSLKIHVVNYLVVSYPGNMLGYYIVSILSAVIASPRTSFARRLRLRRRP